MIEITVSGGEELSTKECIDVFLASHCVAVPGFRTPFDKLYDAYAAFVMSNRMPVGSVRLFSKYLTEKGFRTFKSDSATFKLNIKLNSKCQHVKWRFIDD